MKRTNPLRVKAVFTLSEPIIAYYRGGVCAVTYRINCYEISGRFIRYSLIRLFYADLAIFLILLQLETIRGLLIMAKNIYFIKEI